MSYFGFIPTADLQQKIQDLRQQRHGKTALYPLRDQVIQQLNEELMDQVLGNLIQHLPANEKRDTAEKLLGYVKSSIQVLLGQLLGKSNNDEIQASIDFIEQSLFKDATGQVRIGTQIDQDLAKQLHSNFNAILAGDAVKPIRPALLNQYQNLADQIIFHFMTEFQKSLGLGMIKRKAADMATATIKKSIHIGAEKLILNLDSKELTMVSKQHQDLIIIS